MKRDYFLRLRNAASSKVKRWGYACATLAPCPIVAHQTGSKGRQTEKEGHGWSQERGDRGNGSDSQEAFSFRKAMAVHGRTLLPTQVLLG